GVPRVVHAPVRDLVGPFGGDHDRGACLPDPAVDGVVRGGHAGQVVGRGELHRHVAVLPARGGAGGRARAVTVDLDTCHRRSRGVAGPVTHRCTGREAAALTADGAVRRGRTIHGAAPQ